MKQRVPLLIFSLLGIIPACVTAEEAPDDTIVEEMMEGSSFFQMSEAGTQRAGEYLQKKWLVHEERLSRSNVVVLKITEKHPNAPHLPASDRYLEVMEVKVRGEPTLWVRPLPPEEVQRREMEASGLSPKVMAKGLRAYAGGAVVLGEVLRQEMQNNPMGSLLANTLMPSTPDNPTITGRHVAQGMQMGKPCEQMLEAASNVESESVSNAGNGNYEVKPWTSINPVTFMLGPACMALFAADVMDAIDELDDATKQKMVDALEQALDEISFTGTEELNGRPTARLHIDNVNLVQQLASLQREIRRDGDDRDYYDMPVSNLSAVTDSDVYAAYNNEPAVFYYGEDIRTARRSLVRKVQASSHSRAAAGTFAINSIDLWIDTEYLVDRKMRMEGVMTENGQSRDVFLELESQDYRNVPNSALYEPYKRVMRAGGMMNDAQREELLEAQQELEKFEREMASMPASQRAMLEQMMGGQIEQMRSLVNNGTFEFEIVTTNIEINPSFRNPMLEQFARENMTGSVDADTGSNLVQRIQVDLTTLGYAPGNTDGVLDTMTEVAISQFQAESGLKVTGEPSTELARTLASAVTGQ